MIAPPKGQIYLVLAHLQLLAQQQRLHRHRQACIAAVRGLVCQCRLDALPERITLLGPQFVTLEGTIGIGGAVTGEVKRSTD